MCGLVGICNFDNKPSVEVVKDIIKIYITEALMMKVILIMKTYHLGTKGYQY